MGVPTILRLGQWNPTLESFGPHSANPNNAIIDLNDNSSFTLADNQEGLGTGFDWGFPETVYARSGNLRTRGERITRRNYSRNRQMVAHLYWGTSGTTSYAAWVAAVQDLITTCEGISNVAPAALQFQATGSSTSVYADVLAAQVILPYGELLWMQHQSDQLTVVFECAPLWRGNITTQDNLAWNGGFEGPSGPSVAAFADTFANYNFYATQAGSSPTTTGISGYYDAVQSDTPTRYYRLDESSGTTAYDSMASGNNGALNGGITLGTTGLCTSDPDKAETFNGTTGYINVPTTGLPTGNGSFSVVILTQVAGSPAATSSLWWLGANTGTRTGIWLQMTNTRTIQVVLATTGIVITSAAVSTGTPHLIALTWDGTTVKLTIDNAAALTATPGAFALTYASGGASIGANFNNAAPSQFYPGILDECSITTGTALSAARITAYYTAMTTTPTTLPNTMVLPSGSRVAFGSPAWGAINQWSLRFQPQAGGTLNAYLHYTNSNSNLFVSFANRTTWSITQTSSGVPTTVASSSSLALSGVWYWLVITQFPAAPGEQALIQAQLYSDSSGTKGSLVATLGPTATNDGTSALIGRPQLEAVGEPFTLGGNFASVHTLSLFGPGGWTFAASSGSAYASGAWEQNTTNTYPNGPVQSYGALRVDAPPAGTWDTTWRLYSGGSAPSWSATNTWAVPALTGQVLGGSVYVKSSGLGASATIAVQITEFTNNGTQLRQNTFASLTGNQANWTKLSGTYTIGTGTSYIDIALRVADTSAPGASANATVWADNLLFWNITTTGVNQMPYCETRFPQSPAQIVVSGLQGTVSVPAFVAMGTYVSNWTPGSTLSYALGRREQHSFASQLVGPMTGVGGFASGTTAVLDSGSYGGCYTTKTLDSGGFAQAFLSPHPSDQLGTYRLLTRFWSAESAGNLPSVRVRVDHPLQTDPWFTTNPLLSQFYGPYRAPLTASSTWTLVDAGLTPVPPFPAGALNDGSSLYYRIIASWQDLVSSASARSNWGALLPVDATTLVGIVNNPANSTLTETAWVLLYFDGLLAGRNTLYDTSSAAYSIETVPVPAPAHAAGGPGTIGSGNINLNQTGNTEISLDPGLGGSSGMGGINEMLGVLTDGNGAVLPLVTQVRYIPNYNYPT